LSEYPQDLKEGWRRLLKGSGFVIAAAISHAALAEAPEDSSASDSHPTSSYIRSVIAAGLPKFQADRPHEKTEPTRDQATPASDATPKDVIAMPAFTITESKLPTSRQIMTYAGWTQPLVDKYMGPSDGIDRGVINRFTLAQLWAKIPIIGQLPFVGTAVRMTQAERGLDDAGANNPIRTKPIE
jgi:hypothetical protein